MWLVHDIATLHSLLCGKLGKSRLIKKSRLCDADTMKVTIKALFISAEPFK